VPDWISARPSIEWRPKRASLSTTFVSVGAREEPPRGESRDVFRDGRELLSLLRHERQNGHGGGRLVTLALDRQIVADQRKGPGGCQLWNLAFAVFWSSPNGKADPHRR
jgi:hypothetical protein